MRPSRVVIGLVACFASGCSATPPGKTGSPEVAPIAAKPDATDRAHAERGRLPPEVIQRIVRQNYAKLKVCYERALAKEPELEGLVKVRFVIGRDGLVSEATDAGSTFASAETIECVVSEFRKLRFPSPEGGIVTVVYPIRFSPG